MRGALVFAAAAFGAALLGAAALRARERFAPAWRQPIAPPLPKGVDPLGEAMLKDRRDARSREVARQFARVRAGMDAAKRRGISLDHLEPRMDKALGLARAGRYRDALFHLNLIEVRIPRERERVAPAAENDGVSAVDEDVAGSPVPSKRRSPRRRR